MPALKNKLILSLALATGGAALAAAADASSNAGAPVAQSQAASNDAAAVKKLTAERDQLVESLNTATAELAALRAQAAKNEAKQPATDANARVAELEKSLDETRSAAGQLAIKAQQLEDVASERGRALREAQAQLEELKKQPATSESAAETELTALKADRDLLRKQLDEAQVDARKMAGLPDQLVRAERDIALVRSQNEQLTAKLKQAEATSKDTAAASAELEKARSTIAELNAKISDLSASKDSLDKELASRPKSEDVDALKAKIADLEKANADMDQRLKTAVSSDDVADLKNRLADAEAKLAVSLRSYTVQQQDLDNAKTENQQLHDKLSQAQDNSAALATAQQEITQLHSASINQGMEATALRDQLRQTQAQVAMLAEENAQLKTRIAVIAPPPSASMASPMRPGTAAAQSAITLPASLKTPPPSAAPQPAPAVRQHIVGPGDSLSKISRRYYGTPDRWKDIYNANRDIIGNPNSLPMGAALTIPE